MPVHIEDRSKKALDVIAGVLREQFEANVEKAETDRYDQHGILKVCEEQLKSSCTHCLPVILPQVLYLFENGYPYSSGRPVKNGTAVWNRKASRVLLINCGFDGMQIQQITEAIRKPGWLKDSM